VINLFLHISQIFKILYYQYELNAEQASIECLVAE